MTKRIKLTIKTGEWRPVKELLERRFPYLPHSTAAKLILMELANNTDESLFAVTASHRESPAVPDSHPESPAVTCPDPDPARARSSSGSEKKRVREEKSKNPSNGLAPLDLAERILSDLNQRIGTKFKAKGKKARQLIASRMREGYTEDDFYEVHRKKVKEWRGTDNACYLTYETLYGNKFEKYLGQLDVGPKRGLATTEGEKRTERWERRKEPGYYDD